MLRAFSLVRAFSSSHRTGTPPDVCSSRWLRSRLTQKWILKNSGKKLRVHRQADENVTEHVSFVQNIPISKHPVFVASRCAEIRTQTTAERRRLAFYYNIYIWSISNTYSTIEINVFPESKNKATQSLQEVLSLRINNFLTKGS